MSEFPTPIQAKRQLRKNIQVPQSQIDAFCRRWKVTELAVFGSALRDDFGPESDIDVLVSFESDAHISLFDLVNMQEELTRVIGRPVDLVERKAIEQSPNYIRRKHILNTLEPLYAAG